MRSADLRRRNGLVESHLDIVPPIARHVLQRLPAHFELEDLVQAGYLGLIAAAERYRPLLHNDTPFSAFARQRVRGAMLDSIRRGAYLDATQLPLDEAPDVAQEHAFEESIDFGRRADAVETAVGKLASRHRLVIRRHYGAGEGLATVAVKLKVGASRASQIHLEAVRSLRTRLKVASAS